jgi:hypothetical protein
MFKFNRRFAWMVAALALAIGSGLITTTSYAEIPEQASSQLDQVASAR